MGGRGERLLTFLPPLRVWLVVINPGLPLSTQRVYQRGKRGLTKNRTDNRILMPPQDLEKMSDFLHNDLEASALEFMSVIEVMKERLRQVGAKGVLMTGSGPSVFGLFSTEGRWMNDPTPIQARLRRCVMQRPNRRPEVRVRP